MAASGARARANALRLRQGPGSARPDAPHREGHAVRRPSPASRSAGRRRSSGKVRDTSNRADRSGSGACLPRVRDRGDLVKWRGGPQAGASGGERPPCRRLAKRSPSSPSPWRTPLCATNPHGPALPCQVALARRESTRRAYGLGDRKHDSPDASARPPLRERAGMASGRAASPRRKAALLGATIVRVGGSAPPPAPYRRMFSYRDRPAGNQHFVAPLLP